MAVSSSVLLTQSHLRLQDSYTGPSAPLILDVMDFTAVVLFGVLGGLVHTR